MNILVTGATGFIGSHLVNALRGRANVSVLHRPGSDISSLSDFRLFCYDGHIDTLVRFLTDNHIDGIIHLASLVSGDNDAVDALIDSNVKFPTQIISAAVKADVKWMINTGSVWQNYDTDPGTEIYDPVNLYAATKQAFLDIAKYYTAVSSLRFTTLKFADTYGPGDSRGKLISLFREYAVSGARLDMSPGLQIIDLLHVDDVVQGYLALIDVISDPARQYLPAYTLNSSKRMSLRNLADLYQRITCTKIDICWGGRKYREREVMYPYIGTPPPGWKPSVSFEQGFTEL